MISEIQNKLQKHNKVVFFVLLAVIIVAFVFTIGAAPGLGGEQRTERRDYFGYNLQSERDIRELSRLGSLSYRIQNGQQANPQRLDNYLLERLAYLGLADRLGVPAPTEEQFQQYYAQRPAFLNQQGRFDLSKSDLFLDELEADPLISREDFALVLEQDYRVDRARDLLSGPGYVLPTEVRLELERSQTLWTLHLAKFDLAAFQPEIETSDEAIQTFFEENEFRYERSPRIVFSYAVFPPSNFVDQVGDLDEEEVTAHFEENRDQFTAPTPPEAAAEEEDSEETAEEPEVTLADVRDQVETSLRLRKAQRVAGDAAADFAYDLFQEGERPGDPGFDELLAEYKGELRDAPPANRENFPQQLNFPQPVRDWVFRLSEDREFSDPLQLRDDYIVIIYQETLPAYVPPLEEIRETVQRDFEQQERRRLLSERGEEIRSAIRAQMNEDSSFTEAAEAEGLETENVEPFTLSPPFPQGLPQQILGTLRDLGEGDISPMTNVQNTGYFVFVEAREVPEIDQSSQEFVQTRDRLKMYSTMTNQQLALQEFIQRETNTEVAR